MKTRFGFVSFFSPDGDGGGVAGGQVGADGKPIPGAAGAGAEGDGKAGAAGQTQTFDTWIGTQPEAIKGLVTEHEKGLKSALDSERTSRQDLEGQLRTMAKDAAKTPELQKSLTDMADKLVETDRRADFFDAAHSAGVTNLKLAYLCAVQDEMFDKKGNVNFEALKTKYPELFAGGKLKPRGNAGDGTGANQPAGGGMNAFIRQSAGRS
jgi:hypothetical protein